MLDHANVCWTGACGSLGFTTAGFRVVSCLPWPIAGHGEPLLRPHARIRDHDVSDLHLVLAAFQQTRVRNFSSGAHLRADPQ